MDFEVTSQVLKALRQAAKLACPDEACGILTGDDGQITAIIETANVHPTPKIHFEIDPQALIDAYRNRRNGGEGIVGYFHSHPTGAPEPSITDRAMAAGDGKVWAIIAADQIGFWRDEPDGFCALTYSVV